MGKRPVRRASTGPRAHRPTPVRPATEPAFRLNQAARTCRLSPASLPQPAPLPDGQHRPEQGQHDRAGRPRAGRRSDRRRAWPDRTGGSRPGDLRYRLTGLADGVGLPFQYHRHPVAQRQVWPDLGVRPQELEVAVAAEGDLLTFIFAASNPVSVHAPPRSTKAGRPPGAPGRRLPGRQHRHRPRAASRLRPFDGLLAAAGLGARAAAGAWSVRQPPVGLSRLPRAPPRARRGSPRPFRQPASRHPRGAPVGRPPQAAPAPGRKCRRDDAVTRAEGYHLFKQLVLCTVETDLGQQVTDLALAPTGGG